MLHCFSPEDANKKVTVYDVMHVVVRTVPFQCEAGEISGRSHRFILGV